MKSKIAQKILDNTSKETKDKVKSYAKTALIDVKKRALIWWNGLASLRKTQICDTNTELIGSIRRWETLTEFEIEQIFKNEYRLFECDCFNKNCVYNVSSTCKCRDVGYECCGYVA